MATRLVVSGSVYRAVRSDRRATPLSAAGSLQRSGRYHRAGTFAVLYFALERETVLYETGQRLRTAAGLYDTAVLTHETVEIAVHLLHVVDLTDATVVESLGTSLQELTGSWELYADDRAGAPTQVLGETAFATGTISSLRYPSARHSGRANLAVFPARLGPDESLEVVGCARGAETYLTGTLEGPSRSVHRPKRT